MNSEGKLVVKQLKKPSEESIDELVSWFCRAFDLEDADIEPKILKEIISSSFADTGITSKELDEVLELPKSTLIYHLNKFIDIGLVVRRKRRYYLRARSMKETIEELQNEMFREFRHMLEFADKLDSIMSGLYVGGKERGEKGKREGGK